MIGLLTYAEPPDKTPRRCVSKTPGRETFDMSLNTASILFCRPPALAIGTDILAIVIATATESSLSLLREFNLISVLQLAVRLSRLAK